MTQDKTPELKAEIEKLTETICVVMAEKKASIRWRRQKVGELCREIMSAIEPRAAEAQEQKGQPMELFCPECQNQHIDEGEWETRPHKTHQCQICGHEWRPYPYATVGVKPTPEPQGAEIAEDWHKEIPNGLSPSVRAAIIRARHAIDRADDGMTEVYASDLETIIQCATRQQEGRVEGMSEALEWAKDFIDQPQGVVVLSPNSMRDAVTHLTTIIRAFNGE